MSEQKPMTVADVRAMLSGKPAQQKPADAPEAQPGADAAKPTAKATGKKDA